jgi:hypothetical protein
MIGCSNAFFGVALASIALSLAATRGVQVAEAPELLSGVTVGDVASWVDSLLMAGLLRYGADSFSRVLDTQHKRKQLAYTFQARAGAGRRAAEAAETGGRRGLGVGIVCLAAGRRACRRRALLWVSPDPNPAPRFAASLFPPPRASTGWASCSSSSRWRRAPYPLSSPSRCGLPAQPRPTPRILHLCGATAMWSPRLCCCTPCRCTG